MPPEEAGADYMNPDRPESSSADDSRRETSGGEASGHTEGVYIYIYIYKRYNF